jgi:hypothetical protein
MWDEDGFLRSFPRYLKVGQCRAGKSQYGPEKLETGLNR